MKILFTSVEVSVFRTVRIHFEFKFYDHFQVYNNKDEIYRIHRLLGVTHDLLLHFPLRERARSNLKQYM